MVHLWGFLSMSEKGKTGSRSMQAGRMPPISYWIASNDNDNLSTYSALIRKALPSAEKRLYTSARFEMHNAKDS